MRVILSCISSTCREIVMPFQNVFFCLTIWLTLWLSVCGESSVGFAQQSQTKEITYATLDNVFYRNSGDHSGVADSDYIQKMCRLDVYYPSNVKDFPTVVWFHGGGLKEGNREVPSRLKKQGIAVVAVDYRLNPKVKSPVYIEDAAAAVAWTLKNISKHGGSREKVFVSGHSAGGYLTSMIGLDKKYLAAHDIDANDIAGLIPYSGHAITHFTIRAERGIDGKQPIIDNMAPLFHVRKDASPLVLVTGDRDLEMLGRYEENAYLWRMMQVVKHPDTELHELDGFNHGQMVEPAHPLLLKFVKRICNQIDSKNHSQE